MIKKLLMLNLAIIMFFCFGAIPAKAFEIQKYPDMPSEGDLILGPGKAEFSLNPGELQQKELKITNRTGNSIEVNIDIEDFTGDNEYGTRLLGNEKGPYSLKDYLKPEKSKFILNHGDKASLIVDVDIPKDAEPGGLYGAIIIRANRINLGQDGKFEGTQGSVATISRIASLFFVKVNGETKQEGSLKLFKTGKTFYQNSDVQFIINYENTGRIHLTPYATIDITNLLGKKVDSIEVAPWFVMPGFSRERVINWGRELAIGRYTATLTLNRGYGDTVDTAKVVFYVVPLKILLISISAIFILAIFVIWFGSRFELKKK
jgi:hypothetical protein